MAGRARGLSEVFRAGERGAMTGRGGQPAIDWVSPLPPVRSGIADYSGDLLPLLATRTDLRILTLSDQQVAPRILERYRHGPLAEREAGSERIAVYQMGNNPYHVEVYEAAVREPGVLVLHDYVLHHFHLGRAFAAEDERGLEGYLELLERDHGELGVLAGRPRLRGIHGSAAMFELPMNRSLVRSQRGVIVHNRWVADRLRERDPELRVGVVPMAMPLPELPDDESGRALRQRLGVPRDGLLLGSFGFQTRIKRTHRVIEALSSERLAGAHLLIAGQSEPDLDIELEARRFGVRDRVHSLGYLPFEEFVGAIRACDVCLCLRYPTAGETSAALMRVLAAGRPALVSDYGQFAELPDEVAIKIPPGEEELDRLVGFLATAGCDPGSLRRRGDEARAWVAREHDPELVADRLVAAIEQLATGRPLDATVPRGDHRPSTLTSSRVRGAIEVAGLKPPWPPGERRRLVIELRNEGDCRWLATERGAGGVVVGYRLLAGGRDLAKGERWLPLPRDLAPGESVALTLPIRRPPGEDVVFEVEPHVTGGTGFGTLGGPRYSAEI